MPQMLLRIMLLNRYYSLKGDAEDELDALPANFEALKERNASLREENGVLRRSSAVDAVVKRRRGNDGTGRGRSSGYRSVRRVSAKSKSSIVEITGESAGGVGVVTWMR